MHWWSCDAGMWANYHCLGDCPDAMSSSGLGWHRFKDTKSPYDYDSIMHYSGWSCGSGQNFPFITYKNAPNAPVAPYAIYNSGRLSTQDALQINIMYECPLQKVLQCDDSTFAARSAYLGQGFTNIT